MSETTKTANPHVPSWLEPAAAQLEHATGSHGAGQIDEACQEGDHDPCKDSSDTVHDSFNWLKEYASLELRQLSSDLAKADKPDWTRELLKSLVSISFTGAVEAVADKIGEKVAEKLVATSAKSAAELTTKAFAGALKKGVEKGVDKAVDLLGDSQSPDPAEFIAAQETAVTDLYVEAQKDYNHRGRHEIRTTTEASALEAAVDSDHLKVVARAHYEMSRDNYLSCLAQRTAGVAADGHSTNMAPQSQRHDESRAPSVSGSILGLDRGILSVRILLHDDVTRRPSAWDAVLNGVNDTIREEYKGVSLATVKIPMQLICSVRGDMPDFTVNIDENANMFIENKDAATWLEARARATAASAATLPAEQQQQLGLELLLEDTQLTSIRGRGKS
jgi:hypothetical protein